MLSPAKTTPNGYSPPATPFCAGLIFPGRRSSSAATCLRFQIDERDRIILMIGHKQALAVWTHGEACNHRFERCHFCFRAISDSQPGFVAQHYRFFRLAPMAIFLREDMDIVVFAAASIKMRAIRGPCQPHVCVRNAQRLPLHRLCLLNIENKNIFARLRRKSPCPWRHCFGYSRW